MVDRLFLYRKEWEDDVGKSQELRMDHMSCFGYARVMGPRDQPGGEMGFHNAFLHALEGEGFGRVKDNMYQGPNDRQVVSSANE